MKYNCLFSEDMRKSQKIQNHIQANYWNLKANFTQPIDFKFI